MLKNYVFHSSNTSLAFNLCSGAYEKNVAEERFCPLKKQVAFHSYALIYVPQSLKLIMF